MKTRTVFCLILLLSSALAVESTNTAASLTHNAIASPFCEYFVLAFESVKPIVHIHYDGTQLMRLYVLNAWDNLQGFEWITGPCFPAHYVFQGWPASSADFDLGLPLIGNPYLLVLRTTWFTKNPSIYLTIGPIAISTSPTSTASAPMNSVASFIIVSTMTYYTTLEAPSTEIYGIWIVDAISAAVLVAIAAWLVLKRRRQPRRGRCGLSHGQSSLSKPP